MGEALKSCICCYSDIILRGSAKSLSAPVFMFPEGVMLQLEIWLPDLVHQKCGYREKKVGNDSVWGSRC